MHKFHTRTVSHHLCEIPDFGGILQFSNPAIVAELHGNHWYALQRENVIEQRPLPPLLRD